MSEAKQHAENIVLACSKPIEIYNNAIKEEITVCVFVGASEKMDEIYHFGNVYEPPKKRLPGLEMPFILDDDI